jgi:hypothetical protein
MRFYTGQHRFYCGVDLHARTMHICVLDHDGHVVYNKNLACRPETFLRAIAPFRDGLVVGVECMFAWYWPASRSVSLSFCQATAGSARVSRALGNFPGSHPLGDEPMALTLDSCLVQPLAGT